MTDALALAPAGDAAALKAAAPAALQAVKDWVAAPDAGVPCDFAALPAVTALEADAGAAPVVKLMRALLSGDMAAFDAAATPAALAAAGVDAEAARDKMRSMALLRVAGAAAGAPVALSEVQKALGLSSAAEVQSAIVKAIGRKLLEGRIDQVAGTLTATRCHRRAFDAADWAALAAGLGALGAGLEGVAERLEAVERQQQQQHAAAAAAAASAAGGGGSGSGAAAGAAAAAGKPVRA